jgi:hypothetical protein
MKPNLKINGQQTVKVGTSQRSVPFVFMSLAFNLNGGPNTVQGGHNGRIIPISLHD